MASELTVDLRGCARCEAPGHDRLTFSPLDRPVTLMASAPPMTHWAPCPTNGQPILLAAPAPRPEAQIILDEGEPKRDPGRRAVG